MTVIVVVPFRPDGGHRDALWRRLRDTYWRRQYVVLQGAHTDGPFNRSAAVNIAAASCDWSLMVVADADTWVPPDQLRDALALAEDSGRLVAAFDMVIELDWPTTEKILCGDLSLADSGAFASERLRTKDLETQSSMLVVPRALWDSVGGFDERFCGWGGEDNAFWRACDILGGQPHRIAGPAFHLWHPPADGKHAGDGYQANLRLWRRYSAARTPEQLRRVRP